MTTCAVSRGFGARHTPLVDSASEKSRPSEKESVRLKSRQCTFRERNSPQRATADRRISVDARPQQIPTGVRGCVARLCCTRAAGRRRRRAGGVAFYGAFTALRQRHPDRYEELMRPCCRSSWSARSWSSRCSASTRSGGATATRATSACIVQAVAIASLLLVVGLRRRKPVAASAAAVGRGDRLPADAAAGRRRALRGAQRSSSGRCAAPACPTAARC